MLSFSFYFTCRWQGFLLNFGMKHPQIRFNLTLADRRYCSPLPYSLGFFFFFFFLVLVPHVPVWSCIRDWFRGCFMWLLVPVARWLCLDARFWILGSRSIWVYIRLWYSSWISILVWILCTWCLLSRGLLHLIHDSFFSLHDLSKSFCSKLMNIR